MGRDALTTGTICIFLLYLKYLIDSLRARNLIKEKYDYWIYLLIIFGAASIIFPYWTGILEKSQLGPAVRHIFGFFGVMLLFLIIKNYREDNLESYTDHIERLLSLLLVLVSIHILISISIKIFPSLGSAFSIFYTRTVEIIDFTRGGQDEMERIRSFVFTPESYGEILAVLSPIVIYKIFKFRSSTWLICLLLFCLGAVFTVTRSGIILIIIGIICSILYSVRKKFGKAFALFYILSTLLLLLVYFKPGLFSDIVYRFGVAVQSYNSENDIFATVNRRNIPFEWNLVTSTLSLFGNGHYEFNFHNVLFSVLYQKGIIGATLFFAVLIYVPVRLIKSFRYHASANKALIFSCILSMLLFFINETKFDFSRSSTYQQVCWGLFATYYLVSKSQSTREGQ